MIPDRTLAMDLLRGQFAEHQHDPPEAWAAWYQSLPYRWAQEMVTLWRDNAALLTVVTRLHAAIADLETQAAAAPPGSPRYEVLDAELELLYQIAGPP